MAILSWVMKVKDQTNSSNRVSVRDSIMDLHGGYAGVGTEAIDMKLETTSPVMTPLVNW
jgi:hypothetical protein